MKFEKLISHVRLNGFNPNLIRVTADLAPTGWMTYDLYMTFDLDTVIKKGISLKVYFLLQTTCDGDMGRSCDLTFVGTYVSLTVKGSKVNKGSFPVLSLKTSKIHISRT